MGEESGDGVAGGEQVRADGEAARAPGGAGVEDAGTEAPRRERPPFRTGAERAALLREQLSAAGSHTRSGRRLAESRAANVLVAVALHGAARRGSGAALTDLEQRLTDQLVALFGEEEVAGFGRIYREPASQAGIASLFPQLVAERSLEEGVAAQELRAWLPSAVGEIDALPTARRIGVEEFGQGVLTGLEEVVTVTAPPTDATEYAIDAIHETRLRFAKFRCDRESGESGHDEIYWASGSASEAGAQPQIVMVTRVYGSISTGTVTSFDPDAWFFKGPAEHFVVGHIQCWESDPGGNDVNKLRQGLADVARNSAWAALEATLTGDFTEAIAHVLTVAVAKLIDWILGFNRDDLVKELTINFNRDALVRMAQSNGGMSDLVFDGGGGKYTLTIHTTFGPVIADALRHSIYYAGRWSKQVEIPQLVSGSTRPSMAVRSETVTGDDIRDVRDVLYAVYRRYDGAVQLGRYNGEHWSLPRTVTNAHNAQVVYTMFDPSIVNLNDKLLLLWFAPSNSPNYANYMLTQELDPATARIRGQDLIEGGPNVGIYGQGDLVVHNGSLYRFHLAMYYGLRAINVHRYVEGAQPSWTLLAEMPPNSDSFRRTDYAVAGASFQGRLWMFYWSTPQRHASGLRAMSSTDGVTWRDETLPEEMVRQADARLAPSATVATHGLYENPQPRLFVAFASTWLPRMAVWSYDGRDWAQSEVAINSKRLADWSPFIREHGGNLHMLFNMDPEVTTKSVLTMSSNGAVTGELQSGNAWQSFTVSIGLQPGFRCIRNTYHGLALTMGSDGVVSGQPYTAGRPDQQFVFVDQSDGSKGIRNPQSGRVLHMDINTGRVSGEPYAGYAAQSFKLVPQADGSTGIRNIYGEW